MKNYKYNVIYLNGKQEVFYCNGFIEAIVLAMANSQQKAWNMRIKYITDEKGVTIENIQFPTFEFSKF